MLTTKPSKLQFQQINAAASLWHSEFGLTTNQAVWGKFERKSEKKFVGECPTTQIGLKIPNYPSTQLDTNSKQTSTANEQPSTSFFSVQVSEAHLSQKLSKPHPSSNDS